MRYLIARMVMIGLAALGLTEYLDYLHVRWEHQFVAMMLLGVCWMFYPDPKVTAGGTKDG